MVLRRPGADPATVLQQCPRCANLLQPHREDGSGLDGARPDAFAHRVISCERRVMGEDLRGGPAAPPRNPEPPAFVPVRRKVKAVRRWWRGFLE
jgi:hypothetical protein